MASSPQPPDAARPTCFGCRHVTVKHDRHWPYECAHFGLRTRRLPSLEVRRVSGVDCQALEARDPLPARLTR